MTEYVAQSSASDRLEAARKALAWYDDDSEAGGGIVLGGMAVADALRALITPPSVGENEADMVQTVIQNAPAHVSGKGILFQYDDLIAMVTAAIRAGIQSAHETWEPEVAMQPGQEQMLRWLGIEHNPNMVSPMIYIHEQHIEKEEI